MGGIRPKSTWKLLTGDEIREIDLASIEILEKVGVNVRSEKALRLLKDAGADVDEHHQIAKIPGSLVQEGVKKAPSNFYLCGRNPKYDMMMGDEHVYLGSGGTALNVLDLDTGERRPSLERDLANMTRLVDGLKNVDFCIGHVTPTDIPSELHFTSMWATLFNNTEKNVLHGIRGAEMAKDIIKMASLIVGGEDNLRKRPILMDCCNVVSPLHHDKLMIEGAMECAEHGIPSAMAPEPAAGATGPATLAGTLVLCNAEALSGILIVQLAAPGAPILYGCVAQIMDMRSANFPGGAVEIGLLSAAATQLAHHYGLPVYATGGISDAKVPDAQAGYEKALQMAIVAMSGANYQHEAAGMLETGLTMSYEQLVIDDEILGMVNRILQGIRVDKVSLAVDLIKKVGFKHYLAEKHTHDFFRTEQYMPTLSNRDNYQKWARQGSRSVREAAREKAKKILETHHPQPIDKDIQAEIQKIVNSRRKAT